MSGIETFNLEVAPPDGQCFWALRRWGLEALMFSLAQMLNTNAEFNFRHLMQNPC